MRRSLTLLVACCLLAGCHVLSKHGHISLFEDSQTMTEEAMQYTPIGMPVEEARRVMTLQGFKVDEEEFAGVHYLRCGHSKYINPGIAGVWTIQLYHSEGLVRNVQASYQEVGIQGASHMFPGPRINAWRERKANAAAMAAPNGGDCAMPAVHEEPWTMAGKQSRLVPKSEIKTPAKGETSLPE